MHFFSEFWKNRVQYTELCANFRKKTQFYINYKHETEKV